MNPRNIFGELKRRNVYRVAVAYGVVAWLLIQIATQVFPFFEIPNWVVRLVVLLLGIGFPVALILAWAFELTPEGLKRTDEVLPNESITAQTGRKLLYLIIAVLVLAVALLVFDRWSRGANASGLSKSVAVLPFDNFSDDKENGFFADGVQDDILTSLAKIRDLKVISRTSVMGYRGSARNLREIARALGVTNILEGSVRRVKDRVLVNVQLIDAVNDRHIWANRYEKTMEDAIGLQGQLATEIAAALRATLSPEEKTRVETKQTENVDAFLLYSKGREAQTTTAGLLGDYLRAAELYSEAIARDPQFALARARLSATLAFIYQNFQPTAAHRDRARAEAEEALRLQPELGEGHLARALCFYWLDKNYEGALQELAVAGRLLPNDSDVESTVGYITRRRAHWTEARERLRRVLARDPRNGQLALEIFFNDIHLRDWPASVASGDTAVALGAGAPSVLIYRSYVDFWSRGDLTPLRSALATFPPGVDPDGFVTYGRWDAALLVGDYGGAEKAVNDCALDPLPVFYGPPLPKSYLLGCVAVARGDTARAHALFEEARPSFEKEARESPQDPYRHARLGLLYAFTGRSEEALREGREGVALLPLDRDAIDGPVLASFCALILARCGQTDEALTSIKQLLETPGAPDIYEASITLADLRARWQWTPLAANAQFQQILRDAEPPTLFH